MSSMIFHINFQTDMPSLTMNGFGSNQVVPLQQSCAMICGPSMMYVVCNSKNDDFSPIDNCFQDL